MRGIADQLVTVVLVATATCVGVLAYQANSQGLPYLLFDSACVGYVLVLLAHRRSPQPFNINTDRFLDTTCAGLAGTVAYSYCTDNLGNLFIGSLYGTPFGIAGVILVTAYHLLRPVKVKAMETSEDSCPELPGRIRNELACTFRFTKAIACMTAEECIWEAAYRGWVIRAEIARSGYKAVWLRHSRAMELLDPESGETNRPEFCRYWQQDDERFDDKVDALRHALVEVGKVEAHLYRIIVEHFWEGKGGWPPESDRQQCKILTDDQTHHTSTCEALVLSPVE